MTFWDLTSRLPGTEWWMATVLSESGWWLALLFEFLFSLSKLISDTDRDNFDRILPILGLEGEVGIVQEV